MGPFVPSGSPAGGHSPAGGRIRLLAPWFYFQSVSRSTCWITSLPLLHVGGGGRGFSPFLFFTSLNSCLSETLSLAWLLWQQKLSSCPPVDWSQDFGICSQTGGKAAIQESSLILDGSPQGQSTAWVGACLDWFCCYLFLNKHPPLQWLHTKAEVSGKCRVQPDPGEAGQCFCAAALGVAALPRETSSLAH